MGTPQKTPPPKPKPQPKEPAPRPMPPAPDVDESNEESFPASDPPSWTPTHSHPDREKPR